MKITEMALRASRLTYFVALIIFVAGIATFLNFLLRRSRLSRSAMRWSRR